MSTYWISNLGMDPFEAPSALPATSDTVIVGGGLMGVATAYWLAREGKDVLLLERGELCRGATGRNAGLLLPNSSALEQPALLRQVLADEEIDADYATPGHLALATSAPCWESFQQEAERSRERGGSLEALDMASCEEILGMRLGDLFLGGRWFPHGSVVHSARLVVGLARAAERHGAVIAVDTPVQEVTHRRGMERLRVAIPQGTVETTHVVFACSFKTVDLVPELDSVLRPSVAQVLSTAPLPPLFEIGLGVDFGSVYWRQTPGGSIVLGGGSQPWNPRADADERVDDEIQCRLEGFLARAFPDFPSFEVRHRWAGVMDSTLDGRPVVGPLDTEARRWVVAGFGGHGMPAGLAVGKGIAEGIATGEVPEPLADWIPNRFELQPQRQGRQGRQGS